MKIRPTLYVGLGTTGMEILDYLRGLNQNEYGSMDCPIFRYVSIETDNSRDGNKAESLNYMEYDERGVPIIKWSGPRPESAENKVIHTTIPATEPIRNAINLNHSSYNEHLDAWLDPKILDFDATTRAGGAGNLRMVGRLSLWENWDKQNRVQQNLREAYDAVWEDSNREKAARSLTAHFDKEIAVDEENRNVFIVGTLCGGTCSGMLLDIAYYFRHIGNENTKIYGIFTMYDEALALEAPPIQLANCYAALVELDYYKRSATEYRVTLPTGPAISTNKPPFDVATVVSATNMAGERFIDADGRFVQERLDQMVASDLFARSLGVDALIDADLVNTPTFDDRFENVRESNQFVQHMFGSGIETAWFPKSQTVETAATQFIEKLYSKWKGMRPADTSDPNTLFGRILGDVNAGLVKTRGDSLNTLLKHEIVTLNSNADARDCLAALVEGGKHFGLISENSKDCLKQATESLQGASRAILSQVGELIQSELENSDFPDELAANDEILKWVEGAEECAKDPIKGFLGRLGRKTELNIRKFREEISRQQSLLWDRLRKYFVKRILNDLRGEIQNLIEHDKEERSTVETKFDEVIRRFKVNVDTTIEKVADHLVQAHQSKLESKEQVGELIRILRLSSDVSCFRWHIKNELWKSFNDIVAGLTPDFGPRAVKKSGPYQGFTPSFMGNYRLRLERPGGETRLFRFLLAKQQPENASNLTLESQAKLDEEFPIPHLSVLYQMEVGFTVDDLRVAGRLKEEYDSYMSRGYPIHIDKDPSGFNPDTIRATIAANDRMREIQKDWKALSELLSRIRGINGESRFQYVSSNGNRNGSQPLDVGELEVRVPNRLGYERTFRFGVDNEELAADEERCAAFICKIRCDFASLIAETSSLQKIMNDFNQQIESPASRRESEGFYEDYISLVREHHESHQD